MCPACTLLGKSYILKVQNVYHPSDKERHRWVPFWLPVLSGFILEDAITLHHLLPAHSIDVCTWVFQCHFGNHIEHSPLAVVPHVLLRTPNHIACVCLLPEEKGLMVQQASHTGVRDDTDSRPIAHIRLKATCRRCVHADHAFMPVNLTPTSAA